MRIKIIDGDIFCFCPNDVAETGIRERCNWKIKGKKQKFVSVLCKYTKVSISRNGKDIILEWVRFVSVVIMWFISVPSLNAVQS